MPIQTSRHSRNARPRGRRTFSSNRPGRRRDQGRSAPRRNGGGFSRGGRPQQRARSARKLPTFDPSQFINTNPSTETVAAHEPTHTFSTFGLGSRLTRTIAELGMTVPSPIQDQIIPHILDGRDVIGLAETGTGKTAAFLIPLIEKTLREGHRQTLILVPTRELALQVESELRKLTKGNTLYAVTCVGGVGINPQIRALRKKNHFVIGTPGRILDLINRNDFTPNRVTTVVLDEADRMLDMGFINDMRKILSHVPDTRETLLFSATMSDATKKIVNEFLTDPITISVKKKDVTNSIEQNVVRYEAHSKFETLLELLRRPEYTRVLVFGSMKHSVEKLARELSKSGVKAESIHGNKSHGQRQRALKAFKDGAAHVLVATDVAARGIHVDNISHVINYDLPNTFEDYVHRIGRTGRADKRGAALTFVPAT